MDDETHGGFECSECWADLVTLEEISEGLCEQHIFMRDWKQYMALARKAQEEADAARYREWQVKGGK